MPQEENNNSESNEENVAPPVSLDDVHAKALSDFENDDEDNSDDTTDDQDDNEENKGDDQADDSDSNDDDSDDADDEDDQDDADDESEEDDEDDSVDIEAQETELQEELDALQKIGEDKNIEVDGDYKVEFKDFNGKSYFVRNIAELPDDFEASSQKDLMQNMEKLNEKRAELSKRFQDAREKAAKLDTDKTVAEQVQKVQEGWKQEIKALKLTDQSTISKVYSLMAEWNNKGTPIGSFTAAYEIFKKSQSSDDKQTDKRNKQKKNKGSRVMGSNAPSKKSGPIENEMPFGTTLDQLHSTVMNDFE